jgi:hypothetical protein
MGLWVMATNLVSARFAHFVQKVAEALDIVNHRAAR